MTEPLIARRLAIVPTSNCTLNCKHCGDFLFTGGVKRRDIPFNDVCRDIDACFDLFDRVEWLQFVGGEVFIYKQFAEILKYSQHQLFSMKWKFRGRVMQNTMRKRPGGRIFVKFPMN